MNGIITLLIIRHGLVDNPKDILYYRHVNVPLSKAGFKQMQQVGRKIKKIGLKPDYIYTSILQRAIQSSEQIAKSFPGITIYKEEKLQDAYAPGIETKTDSWLKEIESRGFDAYSHPDLIPIIEPREQVGKRMKSVIDTIKEKHFGKTIIVVSHGDTIAFLKHKLKNPDKPLPSIVHIKKNRQYPNKGEIWHVVLNEKGIILAEKTIELESKI